MPSILMFLALAMPTQASGTCVHRELSVVPVYLPNGAFCSSVLDGGAMCFTLAEYKKLMEMDAMLVGGQKKYEKQEFIIRNQDVIIRQNKLSIARANEETEVYRKRSERLEGKWHDCLNKSTGSISSIFMGASVGVLAGALAGVILTVVVMSSVSENN